MNFRALKFRRLAGTFAICRLPADAAVPDWARLSGFSSVTRTDEELSIVCSADNVPEELRPELPWTCLKLEGPFSFSEVGILASFINPLAQSEVPIFAFSTYDTDYVLVSKEFEGQALTALQSAGHKLLIDG